MATLTLPVPCNLQKIGPSEACATKPQSSRLSRFNMLPQGMSPLTPAIIAKEQSAPTQPIKVLGTGLSKAADSVIKAPDTNWSRFCALINCTSETDTGITPEVLVRREQLLNDQGLGILDNFPRTEQKALVSTLSNEGVQIPSLDRGPGSFCAADQTVLTGPTLTPQQNLPDVLKDDQVASEPLIHQPLEQKPDAEAEAPPDLFNLGDDPENTPVFSPERTMELILKTETAIIRSLDPDLISFLEGDNITRLRFDSSGILDEKRLQDRFTELREKVITYIDKFREQRNAEATPIQQETGYSIAQFRDALGIKPDSKGQDSLPYLMLIISHCDSGANPYYYSRWLIGTLLFERTCLVLAEIGYNQGLLMTDLQYLKSMMTNSQRRSY